MSMYISKTELQNYIGAEAGSSLDDMLDEAIETAQRWVEDFCANDTADRRWFDDDDSEKTKWYNGNDNIRRHIDDLRSVTTVEFDGIEITEGEDFHLYPLNESPKEYIELVQPETSLTRNNSRVDNQARYTFEKSQKTLKVVGKFGYSTDVPGTIKMAVRRLAAGLLKSSRDSDIRPIEDESLGDYSVSYEAVDEIADRLGIGDQLEPYRRKSLTEIYGSSVNRKLERKPLDSKEINRRTI